MFATLIIGLREGLEAALIVGIIAAFLRRQGRTDAMRWMWAGITVAVAICVAVAVALEVASHDLPQRQQEALETVIGAVAVAMVTYMIVWMRDHARDMKGQLESAAADAIHRGSVMALVAMAFLAVLREGLETAVFLIAAFNASGNAVTASTGALIGILVSAILGYALYRGGLRINLARFFTATGLILVLVAAGLVMTALRTAHEAGWLNVGQQQALDLTWLVRPGSLQSSLLTGVLGLQAKPVMIEVAGWLVYVAVIGTVVLWPQGRKVPWRAFGYVSLIVGLVLGVGAAATYASAPTSPGNAAGHRLELSGVDPPQATGLLAGHFTEPPGSPSIRLDGGPGVRGEVSGLPTTVALSRMERVSATEIGHHPAATYRQLVSPDYSVPRIAPGAPDRVTIPQIITGNGGRLPLGITPSTFGDSAPVVYTSTATVTVDVDQATHWPLDADVHVVITATVTPRHGSPTVLGKVATFGYRGTASAADLARVDAIGRRNAEHHQRGVVIPVTLTVLAALAAVLGLLALLVDRRRRRARRPAPVGGSASAPDAEPDEPTDPETSDTEPSITGAQNPANAEEMTR